MKSVDGQRNSVNGSKGWTSSNTLTANHTEWIKVDLGSAETVSKVDLYPRNDTVNVGYGFPVDLKRSSLKDDGVVYPCLNNRNRYITPIIQEYINFFTEKERG